MTGPVVTGRHWLTVAAPWLPVALGAAIVLGTVGYCHQRDNRLRAEAVFAMAVFRTSLR